MNCLDIYSNEIPGIISELCMAKELQRLSFVGMNCGCEYTSFERFRNLQEYTRFEHSIGTALITWNFTGDLKSSAAALLHDIATPCFAHTVDFLNGDYEKQESTEYETEKIIRNSGEIKSVLEKYGINENEVIDYGMYSIADNKTPRLCADRLEYTIGNMINYGFSTPAEAKEIYSKLTTAKNEDGEDEIVFTDASAAEKFALLALECSKVYTSPEDRYAMQRLSELLYMALNRKTITKSDLHGRENDIINKILNDDETKEKWEEFTSLRKMEDAGADNENARIIPAKKRRIDPLVISRGRVSTFSSEFREKLKTYMTEDFTLPISAR